MDRDDRIIAFLQGTLDESSARNLEADIANDPALAAEVAALRGVRNVLSEETYPSQRERGWERLSATLESEARPVANDNRPIRFALWQVAATVAGAVLLWQATVVPVLSPDNAGDYVPVSEAVDGPVLQVAFTANATMAEISALLAEVDGTITAGPGSIGIYHVTFASAEALERGRRSLEERTDLIRMIVGQ